jgi:hypothetical protein
MRVIIMKLLLAFIVIGVVFATPIMVGATEIDSTIKITSYDELPLSINGTVEIEFIEIIDKKEMFNLKFIDSNNNKVYLRENVGLPPVYKRSKTYETTYEVIMVDGLKSVFMDFYYSPIESIRWELTGTGKYYANNVVTVTSSFINHKDGYLNTSPVRNYFIHFNTSVNMDKIYQIDLTYHTRIKTMFVDTDYLKVDDTLYHKQLNVSTGFKKWFANYIGIPTGETISSSTVNGYDWQALVLTDVGTKVPSLPIYNYPDREFQDLKLLKFYYVTDGEYFESDDVIHDPIDYESPTGVEDWFEDFEKIFKSIKDGSKDVFDILIIVLIISIAIPILSLIPVIFKSIFGLGSLIFLIIKFIFGIPINLLNLLGISKNKNYSYKRKRG